MACTSAVERINSLYKIESRLMLQHMLLLFRHFPLIWRVLLENRSIQASIPPHSIASYWYNRGTVELAIDGGVSCHNGVSKVTIGRQDIRKGENAALINKEDKGSRAHG